MGVTFIKIAVVYFIAGVALGLFMAISQDHSVIPVHAHVNLLGWVSLALCGLVHQQFPTLQAHWLAKAHFWLHNIGLPIGMIGLFFFLRGHDAVRPAVAAGSMIAGLGVMCFGILVVQQLGRQ